MNLTTHHLSSSNFCSLSNPNFHNYLIILLRRNFNVSVAPYQDALDKSRCKHKLKYQANMDTANNKNQRKRNIIWFNPPYSKNVKTKLGNIFLNTFHLIIDSTNYLTRMQWKLAIVAREISTTSLIPIMQRFYSLKKLLNKEHTIA